MNSWPREVADSEAIARGICTPFHLKKGKVTFDAYLPPKKSDEVSTMRADWLGPDACKMQAKKLANPSQNKVYVGFAVLSAKHIRESGAEIIDTREVYSGHADIRHGIKLEDDGNPAPPEKLKELRDRCKKLAGFANFIPDPEPSSDRWTGKALRYK